MVSGNDYPGALLFLGIFTYIVYRWIRELNFYRRNGWDFAKDSDCAFRFMGSTGIPNLQVSNATRIKLRYPLMLIVTGMPGIVGLVILLVRDYG
jgi:hypothetical protein